MHLELLQEIQKDYDLRILRQKLILHMEIFPWFVFNNASITCKMDKGAITQ